MPNDDLPLHWAADPGSDDLLTVSAQEMGSGHVCGSRPVLADRVAGRESEWARALDPWRAPPLGSSVHWPSTTPTPAFTSSPTGSSAAARPPTCSRARANRRLGPWPEGSPARLRRKPPRGFRALYPPRLHRQVERTRADVGLPLPRLALRRRGRGPQRACDAAAEPKGAARGWLSGAASLSRS